MSWTQQTWLASRSSRRCSPHGQVAMPMLPVGGLKEGWPAIREYFAHGLERYPDLVLVPTGEFWARPDGLALQWQMSATVIDDSMGAGHLGKKWNVPGLSFVVFDGLKVAAEYDYHDKGARQRSLEG